MENRYHFNNDFGILRDCGTLLLKQVGEMLCGAGAGSPEHAQTFAEVTFAASGRGVCRTDGVAAAIGPGDCYLSFPGETHEIVSDASDRCATTFSPTRPPATRMSLSSPRLCARGIPHPTSAFSTTKGWKCRSEKCAAKSARPTRFPTR